MRGAQAYSQAMNCHGRQLGQSTGAFAASPGQLCCFLGQGHKNKSAHHSSKFYGVHNLASCMSFCAGMHVLICSCAVITTTRPAPVSAFAGHMIQGTCSVQASHPPAGRPEWLRALGNAPAVHRHGRLKRFLITQFTSTSCMLLPPAMGAMAGILATGAVAAIACAEDRLMRGCQAVTAEMARCPCCRRGRGF